MNLKDDFDVLVENILSPAKRIYKTGYRLNWR